MATAVSEHDVPREQSNWQRYLEIALILVVCFVHGGAPPPQVNESHYLPKAKHYWQPDWCAGDPFLESADAHLTFYWTIGWLTQFFSLATVAWIGRLAAWLAFAWSWQRLSRCVTDARFASVLSAALFVWLTSNMNFAGEWVVGGVEGKTFAYPCVFLGLANLSQGRWNRAWPWLGLGGAFHVLVGGWAAIAAGLVWLLESRQTRPSLLSMGPSLILGLLLALPGILPALALTAQVSAEESREAARIYVFERLRHHLALLHQTPERIVMLARRFAVPLLGFLYLWGLLRTKVRNSTTVSERQGLALDRICRFSAATFLIGVIGLLVELARYNDQQSVAPLLKYYWFRLADAGVALAASLLVCSWIARLFRQRNNLAPAALGIALLLPAWHLADASISRWRFPAAPADAKLAGVVAWHEACDWAKQNSTPDDLFLVPRTSQSLSWHAGRKSLVTWKDVPQDAASLIDWFNRYSDVFLVEDEFGQMVPVGTLALLGTERIRELANKYKIDYVIAREYPPLDFPQVYGNAWYSIYDVSPASDDSPKEAPPKQ